MTSTLFRLGAIAAEKEDRMKRQADRPDTPTLREFLIDSWSNVLHPSETLELEGAWYIDLICEWLTVVTVGTLIRVKQEGKANELLKPYGLTVETLDKSLTDVRQLLINVSPRCSKSTIVTVCWPCWEWLTMPWLSYMCMSYAQPLASDHNDDRRSIIQSEWYQRLSGGMALSNSKNRITEFKNNQQGQMVGRGLEAGITGGGGMRLVFDDPNNPISIESDKVRNATQKSFDDYSITRRNNPKLTAVVNVQQRTHDRDISGSILANPEGWVTVVVPMEAEAHERVEFPLSKRVIDRSPGELMHPDRFPHDIITTLKRKPGIWAGRYQQRPNVSGGGIFKIRNWRLYVDYPESLDRTIMSVDAAFKGEVNSDFVVVGVVGQRCNVRQLPGIDGEAVWEHEYYLPYRWRSQADIIRTESAIGEVYLRFPQCYIKLIEDKANGPAIITRLSGVIPGITPYKPGTDSKRTRAVAMQPVQERGDLLLPLADWAKDAVRSMGLDSISIGQWWDLYPPAHESDAEYTPVDDWVRELIDEAAMFPNGQYDDQVDMFAQAVNWMEVQPSEQAWFGFGSDSAS
jgi:hypothetical protein